MAGLITYFNPIKPGLQSRGFCDTVYALLIANSAFTKLNHY